MSVYDDKGLFQMADMDLAHHDRILRLLYAAVLDSRKWVEVLHEMRALFAAKNQARGSTIRVTTMAASRTTSSSDRIGFSDSVGGASGDVTRHRR